MAELPIGSIVLWGNDTIPTGWQVCDGTNGTPNLIGNFIKGAADGELGQTGGAASHNHTNSVGSRSDHNHGGSVSINIQTSGGSVWANSGTTSDFDSPSTHGHSDKTVTLYSGGAHTHSMGNTSYENNIPLSVKRVFIMRIS